MKLDQNNKITIFGVGLIGGSLGLALKKYGFNGSITGLGRRMSTLKIALERNAVDQITLDFCDGMASADLVVIATPVNFVADSIQKFSPFAPKGCIFTDVGSVKGSIVAKVEEFLPEDLYFVGAHPMAGSEKNGIGAARATLFDGATCILTQVKSTDQNAFQVVKDLWETVGANVQTMTPDEHDYLIAAASHLPHVVASVLTQTVAEIENNHGKALDFTATGFRDTTRIAAGSADVWQPVLSDNRRSVLEMIDEFIDKLNVFKQSLIKADEDKLRVILLEAKQIRDSLNDC